VQKLDITICTFNSEHTIEDCINSILDELPVNKIICVDGGSTDKTLDILKKYKEVIVYIKKDLNLGQSRSFAFSQVETEWFVQIDSDVILNKGAGEKILSFLGAADVIEFGCVDYYSFPMPSRFEIESGKYEKRAFFFANLIKRNSVKGIDLNVRNMEEELLRVILKKRNMTWLKTGLHVGNHYSKPVRYNGRQIVGLQRVKKWPNFVYRDKGYIDKINNVTIYESIISFLRFYLGPIVNQLLKSFKSFNDPFSAIFSYYKGYFYKKKNEV